MTDPTSEQVTIVKVDEEQRIVTGVVYAPNVVDSHGDFATAEEIRKAAHNFMMKGDMLAVDIMHDNVRYGCPIVESFIARKGDPDFEIEGSWVASVHIPDDTIWGLVKAQKLNGFSMEAMAFRRKKDVDAEIPYIVQGMTLKSEDGHEHEFEVMYDENGKFLGGKTSVAKDADGIEHFHLIQKGVISDTTLDHAHRFSSYGKIVKAHENAAD